MRWQTATLAELCDVDVGRTPARANPAFWGVGEPWLAIADMRQGRTIATTKEQITHVAAAAARQVPAGTVLLSFKLSIGKVARASLPLYTNEAIAALPIKRPDLISEDFLVRVLEQADLGAQANRAAMGATLNKASLKLIPIPIPPLSEQRRIAAILDQADALRAKRREQLAHLDTLTQSIFHAMFGTGSFPALRAGELMPTMRNGVSPSTAGSFSATVLTLSAVTRGRFDPASAKTGHFSLEPSPEKRIGAADFLMCRGNGNRNLVGVGTYSPVGIPDLVFPDTIIAGRVDNSKITMPFLDVAWRQREVRRQIEAVARTTNGTYKVNQKTLAEILVGVPPLDLQHQFGTRLEQITLRCGTVHRAVTAADELFASLQARAFSGGL